MQRRQILCGTSVLARSISCDWDSNQLGNYQRHGCKRVKFSVYVKEGRASLKATPVKE